MTPIIQALLDQFMKRTDLQGAGGGGAPRGISGPVPYAGGGDPSGFVMPELQGAGGGAQSGGFVLGNDRLLEQQAMRRPQR
jgi:hypothetical protein